MGFQCWLYPIIITYKDEAILPNFGQDSIFWNIVFPKHDPICSLPEDTFREDWQCNISESTECTQYTEYVYIYIYMIYIPVPSYVAQIWVREILGTFEDFSVRLMNFRAFCQFMRVCVFRCHIQPFPTRPTALSTTAAAAAAGSIEEARQCRVSQFFFSVSRAFCISSKHG